MVHLTASKFTVMSCMYIGFEILNTTFHGFGTSLVSISNLDCPQGTQSDITECTYDISSMTESCNDVAVTCIGEVATRYMKSVESEIFCYL